MGMKTTVLKSLSTPALNWKDDQPGQPWTGGDTVDASHNSIVLVQAQEFMESAVVIRLPAITPESAGQRIEIINMLGLKEIAGMLRLQLVNLNDFIEAQSGYDSPDLWIDFNESKAHFWVQSDGNNRWSFHFPDGGLTSSSSAST